MLQIGDGEQVRIVKGGGGQFESDTMLAGVGFRFGFVPLELKRTRCHSSVSRTTLSRQRDLTCSQRGTRAQYSS
jgi:hypothetical protein